MVLILMKNVSGYRNPTFQHHKGKKEGVQLRGDERGPGLSDFSASVDRVGLG